MKILSIDPGETSGMCMATLDADVFTVDNLESLPYENLLDLIRLGEITDVEFMLVETYPVMSRTTDQITKVLKICILVEELFPMVKLRIIYPSHWKYMAKTSKWKVPTGQDQHQKDAYNIMRFFIKDLYNLDTGDAK